MTPLAPMVLAIRPQFGSQPKRAVFTKSEFERAFAACSASLALFAPRTSKATTFVLPSPSRTIFRAISSVILFNANAKASLSYAPLAPELNSITVSFVLVSPSTLIALKLAFMALSSSS